MSLKVTGQMETIFKDLTGSVEKEQVRDFQKSKHMKMCWSQWLPLEGNDISQRMSEREANRRLAEYVRLGTGCQAYVLDKRRTFEES